MAMVECGLNGEMHALVRAKERFDLDLVVDDLIWVTEQIKAGKTLLAKKDRREGRECEHHVLRVRGVALRAVYFRDIDRVATFLPVGATEETHQMRHKRGKNKARQPNGRYNRAKGRRKTSKPRHEPEAEDFY